MKTNIVIDTSPPIPYLGKFWFLSYGPECCWPIKLKDSLKCNISGKTWMMKFIFVMQHANKHPSFLQVHTVNLGVHSQTCPR